MNRMLVKKEWTAILLAFACSLFFESLYATSDGNTHPCCCSTTIDGATEKFIERFFAK